MKTATKIFEEYILDPRFITGDQRDLINFTIETHDAEIRAMIDEMIEEKYKYSVENGLTALTELRAKL